MKVYESAIRGGLIFAVTWLVLTATKTVCCGLSCGVSWQGLFLSDGGYGSCFDKHLPFELADSLTITVLVGFLAPPLVNRRIGQQEIQEMYLSRLRKTLEFGDKVMRAWENETSILIVSQRGRALVGWVAELPGIEPDREAWEVEVEAIFEGHVDQHQKLIVTLDYLDATDLPKYCLPSREIVSIVEFDSVVSYDDEELDAERSKVVFP